MHKFTAKNDHFIITAPTYKIMSQSTLPMFLAVMDGRGTYNKSEGVFDMHGGGKCFMRTGTEPDSIVGLTNVRHIWCDEAGKYTLYFWENIQGRAAFKACPITITTSPYTLNWVYKDLIRPLAKGKRDDIHLCQARSDENPYFPKEEYERRRQTMDPRRFNAMYGGQFEKMEGLVYDCFDEYENSCNPVTLPMGTKYVAGVDWGHTKPFALVVRGITPEGRHYQVSEIYKTGLTILDMIQLAQQKQQIWGIERFYCDPAEPGYIEEFNRHGLLSVGARNDIRVGIDLHYELIKTRKYKIFKGAGKHTIDEYDNYRWPEDEDLGPNRDEKERTPVKQSDHAMDANRYVTISTYRSHKLHTPKVANEFDAKREPLHKRLERLKKPKLRYNQTEVWSK